MKKKFKLYDVVCQAFPDLFIRLGLYGDSLGPCPAGGVLWVLELALNLGKSLFCLLDTWKGYGRAKFAFLLDYSLLKGQNHVSLNSVF